MNRIPMIGEPVPWFHAPALDGNLRYAFDTAAGRWIVMLFAGQTSRPEFAPVLELLAANRDLFDDFNACSFGVTVDPSDAAEGRIAQLLPGVRWFLDYDQAVSQAYGAAGQDGMAYQPYWLLLDPLQRVVVRAPLAEGRRVLAECRRLALEPRGIPAPVLVAPRILSPEICRRLIDLYERQEGQESGFMRDVGGVTTAIIDHSHKRRADCTIDDEELLAALKSSLLYLLCPLVKRAFQFEPSRIERWIVACYDGATTSMPRNTRAATCAFPSSARRPTAPQAAVRWCSRARCCTRRGLSRRPTLRISAVSLRRRRRAHARTQSGACLARAAGLPLGTAARGSGGYFSLSRGISSTKLHGRLRLSSCSARIRSQPSFTAPFEPGRANR